MDILDTLSKESPQYIPPPPKQLLDRELVIQKNGEPRQAGSTDPNGRLLKLVKKKAETDLHFFCKAILGLTRLTNHLHREVCEFIQKIPPYRKLIMLPRDTFKSTIVSKGLPIHKFIQPKESNVYWPGHNGLECKILLSCETEHHASKHIQWIQQHFERNALLRVLWPDKCWDAPRRQARKWNSSMFFLPRDLSFEQSDPTMQGIGVGGAITGGHFTDLINDDLISLEARGSESVMETAKEWQRVSRPMMEDLDISQEFTVGTHWATNDLYAEMIENDPTVSVYKRSLIENGKIIFPEEFSKQAVHNLKESLGPLFSLLYLNNPRDAGLTDFRESDLRFYEEVGNDFIFEDDERDQSMVALMMAEPEKEEPKKPEYKQYASWADIEFKRDAWITGKFC